MALELTFTLMDQARWLNEILTAEALDAPVIIGQSMGGYVGQVYAQMYPQKLKGFISIDSAPLQKKYVSAAERWLLKRMEPVYRYYPWRSLLKSGTNGVAESPYGRELMRDMMMVYDGQQDRYAKLAGHGFRISLIVPRCCSAGKRTMRVPASNKAWSKDTGIRLEWIKGAGHNSNTDRPEVVNGFIEEFIQEL